MNITFFSSIDGVADAYPITPASAHIPAWVHQVRAELKSSPDKRGMTLARCPGIMDLMRTGYIVTAPYDMDIEVNNDVIAYVNPVMEEILGKPPVQVQGDIAVHLPKRPWSNANILKINTPWHIKASCKFLMIPITYTDNFGFEANIGILDPSVSSEINIQGYINGAGVLQIKAGDPLCQLIPLVDGEPVATIRDANDADKRWLRTRKYINNATWILKRGIVKRLYDKYLKGEQWI